MTNETKDGLVQCKDLSKLHHVTNKGGRIWTYLVFVSWPNFVSWYSEMRAVFGGDLLLLCWERM